MKEKIMLWCYLDLSRFKMLLKIHPASLSTWLKCVLAFSGQGASSKIAVCIAVVLVMFGDVCVSSEIGISTITQGNLRASSLTLSYTVA